MSASGAFIMGRYIAERSALGRKIFRVLKPDSRGPLSRSANVTNGSTSDVSNGWKDDISPGRHSFSAMAARGA